MHSTNGIAALLTAIIATAVLIHLLSPLARRIGLVDAPRGHKTHEGEVPLVGGLAMFCGFLFAVLIPQIPLTELRPLFAGSALLVIVGVLDDFHELAPNSRFVAQIGAGLLMVLWGGIALEDLGQLIGPEITTLGTWGIPFTIFSVVGVVNALNMLDGMDGLAGGLSLIVFSLLALTAFQSGDTANAIVLFLLAAVVFAFLLFNLRLPRRTKALVFMGDAGSMFLGFAMAWFLIDLSQPQVRTEVAVITPVTALWILALPLMDTVRIMLRRILGGRSPLVADREHLHHLLGRLGLGVTGCVTLILTLTALLAVTGLWAQSRGIPEHQMFAAFLALFAIYFAGMESVWRRLNRLPQALN